MNPQSIAAKIRYAVSCGRSANYFTLVNDRTNKNLSVTVKRAPEPEDIIWSNIGVPY